jgi:ABC-type multidrug transport system fused ATPase/permease subunit
MRPGPWRRLWTLSKPYRSRFVLVALFSAIAAAAQLVEPLVYRVAVNDVAGVFVGRAGADTEATVEPKVPPTHAAPSRSTVHRPPHRTQARGHHRTAREARTTNTKGHVASRSVDEMFRTLLWAVALLFVTAITAQFFELLADNAAETAANHIEEDFIRTAFGHVLRLRLGFFSRRAGGAIAKQIDQSDQVAPIVTAFAKDILPETFRVLGTFAIMFTQSPRLTFVALATVPAYLLVARRSAKMLETQLPRYYSLWEDVSARIRDAVTAVKTVKLSGAEAREVDMLSAASGEAYATYLNRNRLANRYLFLQVLLQRLGQAMVLAYGGFRVLEHQLTPGDVVMFVTYLDRLYDPIDSLTTLAKTLQEHTLSVTRALGLLATPDAEPSGVPLRPGPGRVEFRDMRFGYVSEREVLHGVSFVLRPGAVTALVGPSGAGKTTIADLLLRLYEPTGGAIMIDGQALGTIEPASIRRSIGVVSTDGAVFRGTLASNIRYKRPDATDAEVEAAAAAAGLGRTVARLTTGLATEIGDGGVGLSAGERQRLQIARAFASDPRILVLDEATANLDYATEIEIKDGLDRLRKGRTVLMISHRYSMVKDADHVIVIDAGRVAEEGTPSELLATGGWFARLASGEPTTEHVGDGEPAHESDDEIADADDGAAASS